MNKEELLELVTKVSDGEATEQEIALFNKYYNAYQKDNVAWDTSEMGPEQKVHDELKHMIFSQVRPQKKVIPFWRKPYRIVAAAVILVVGSVLLFNSTDDRIYVEAGKNTATLTLANGKAIALSDAKSGLVIDAGKLTYDDGSSVSAALGVHNDNENAMLSISTPKGGTYEIVLTDGTHVWLNADSKLEFPAKFSSARRLVKLSGEGYFEVAKNKQSPFRVLTKAQEIEVLGTHFNVDAYDNEKSVKTTLLEGLVKVSANGVDKLLDPGFQAVNTGERISIAKVDVNAAVAWKNKQFVFESENIKSIMRKVERWYNVEVVYTDDVSEETFSGGVSRFDNLSEVLKSLESTGNVSFKVKGRIVYVSM
ncbi:FecR family protein [Pedobacter frigoris]|uniref:FecR family protein n=1 Tax=Pedobacter frigoris TaxID=2571272 RepID=UPI0029303366|nr:FecR domain-containing protein [Pedobacter frigoris]